MRALEVGDWVIYEKDKVSRRPGRRAHDVFPSVRGEEYRYLVDKFWLVWKRPDPEHVIAITRTGKQHRLDVNDPRLRRPSLYERFRHRHRFPGPKNGAA